MAALLVAAAVLLGPERAAAKLVQGELSLSSFITDQYISKFSFSEAQDGHIRVRPAADSPHSPLADARACSRCSL